MARPKSIFCPRCNRRVAFYDGKTKVNVSADCRKCKKRVIYCIDRDEAILKDIPARKTSSGLTFS